MDPPPTYHEILLQLREANKKIVDLTLQNKELNQQLYKSKETCELYRKAYAHVKTQQLKIINPNKLSNL